MTTPTHPNGRRETRGEHEVLVLTRRFDAPVEDVWAAVTEPDRLARWIGTWDGDPVDGFVGFRMTAEAEDAAAMRMWIDACDPPRRLEVHSSTSDGGWYLALDLEESDGVTTLDFSQRMTDPDLAANVGPGWDYYLDRLVAAETGGDVAGIDFGDYHPADSDYYRGLFSTTSA
jgi:uncharacterized protein YndB with AHSA1/START domain